MPFPPSFTNIWDNTFPPDTQAANQLGLDLRNLRLDISQKLSLLSGTLANQPANMEAIFGGTGFGILYFATDTGQIFQWSGAPPAWVDITAIMTGGRVSNIVPVITNASNVDGISVTIPANALQVNTTLRIVVQVALNTNDVVQLFFGATLIGVFGLSNPNVISGLATAEIVVSGAASQVGLITTNTQFTTGGGPVIVNNSLSQSVLVPTEAINAPIIVKTHQSTSALGQNVTHKFIMATWK